MSDNNNCGVDLARRVVFLVAFLWIGCNYQGSCFGLPRFQSVPTTVKTFENNTVTLPCVYSGAHLSLRWYFGDLLIAENRNHHPVSISDRIKTTDSGSLLVDHVQPDDTGDYHCEILFADSPPIRQEHAIEVQFPPSAATFPSGNIFLRLGSAVEITCDARGVPLPIVSWRRVHPNGAFETLRETRRQLRIDIANRDVAGTYQCLANNGVEEPAVAGVNVHVNYIPEVTSSSVSVHTKIGYRAVLECIVLASPSGTVQWYHHGLRVTMDNHIARSDVDVGGSEPSLYAGIHTKHTLIIRSVRDRDMGMYECRAENELGSKGVLINLNGMPKQSIFKSSPIRSMGRTFNLLWQTESYSPISEYRLRFRPEVQQRRQVDNWRDVTIPAEYSDAPIHTAAYSLSGLEIGAVYEVAVMSRNRYGWGPQSKTYRFATGGEVESPSKISEETYDDSLMMSGGDEIEDNSIDDLPGVFDYSYSTGWVVRKSDVLTVVMMTVVVIFFR